MDRFAIDFSYISTALAKNENEFSLFAVTTHTPTFFSLYQAQFVITDLIGNPENGLYTGFPLPRE